MRNKIKYLLVVIVSLFLVGVSVKAANEMWIYQYGSLRPAVNSWLVRMHKVIGGVDAGSKLQLQGTTGIGTTSASSSIEFLVGDYGTTTAAVILNSGDVGIGTTTPEYTLDVNGGFRVGNATTTNAIVYEESTGKVGIGTTSPATQLDVNGTVTIRTGGLASHAICWEADGITLGYCSSVIAADGTCTCE